MFLLLASDLIGRTDRADVSLIVFVCPQQEKHLQLVPDVSCTWSHLHYNRFLISCLPLRRLFLSLLRRNLDLWFWTRVYDHTRAEIFREFICEFIDFCLEGFNCCLEGVIFEEVIRNTYEYLLEIFCELC